MSEQDQGDRLIQRLVGKGVGLWATIPSIGGSRSVQLDPRDISIFLDDHDGWIAKMWGVSREDYFAWQADEGIPRCTGITAKGARCKNGVVGPPDMRGAVEPPQYVELVGGHCAVHDPR